MQTPILRKISRQFIAALSLLIGLSPLSAMAASYVQDTTITVSGTALKVMAGSEFNDLAVSSDNFRVTLGAGQTFIVRSPGPTPKPLENDVLQPPCHVLTTNENQLVLNGPMTATVHLGQFACSTTNSSTDQTPMVTFIQPNGGETFKEGQQYQLFWQSNGSSVASVRLSYSVDGGLSWQTIVDNKINDGGFSWTVPQVPMSSTGRLRIHGVNQGNVVSMDVTNGSLNFEGTLQAPIQGGTITIVPAPYDPAEATTDAATIGDDKALPTAAPGTTTCTPEIRMKLATMDTIYYCGRDGKRYVFPTRKIHDSWYDGFAGVVDISAEAMQRIPLGGNVTYRPGVRMVKVTSSPEVFAVDQDGLLHHVATEAAAARLYGPNWNQKIDDLPDAFFTNYSLGEPILE